MLETDARKHTHERVVRVCWFSMWITSNEDWWVFVSSSIHSFKIDVRSDLFLLHQILRNHTRIAFVRAMQLYRKKVSKTRADQHVFSFIFGLRMASRSVTRHSTAGSETLLLCSLFLMLPQYDDDEGAINSLLSLLLLSASIARSHSFIRLFARSIAFSFFLCSLCVCALAKRANSIQHVLYQVLFSKFKWKKGKKAESMKEMTRKRARKRTDKQNNEQIFSCCIVTFLRTHTHRENKQLCGFNSWWRCALIFFSVSLSCLSVVSNVSVFFFC